MDMLWNGWGDPARAKRLPESVVGLLRDMLGVTPRETPVPAAPDDIEVPPTPLSATTLAAFAEALSGEALGGQEHERQERRGADRGGDGRDGAEPGWGRYVRTDAVGRVRHTRGKSTPDLLRLRAGDVTDLPAAVLLPGSHDEVLAVLRLCAEHQVSAVPFGGGTSVVGGLAPEGARPFVALDLRRLNTPPEIDEVSRTAVLPAGLRAPKAEALLNERGYTLGHFPQSFEWATIGGFAAARSSGQASAGYGRFDEMVLGLTVATPEGGWQAGRAPRSAAGPDLRQLVLGSEGAFGVITSVTVRIRPLPVRRVYEGWRFASFEAGAAALRGLAQDGPRPTVLRLSDETETFIGLAHPDRIGSTAPETAGCMAVVGYEGTAEDTAERRSAARKALTAAGGTYAGEEPGEHWARGRYDAPYLRDALLDAGAFAETLETAAFWSDIPALYEGVRRALTDTLTEAGTTPLVMCHISHVYENGASLYFTVVSAQGEDPVAHWEPAKHAANEAILEAGGTISHHHGVGTDHRDWYAREAGELGIRALSSVKAALDPDGILNPGILLPAPAPAPAPAAGSSSRTPSVPSSADRP
ncbi:FAD-binding oxidoreductase [Streptomyces lichenis]|uniref:FAD-binding oxidoreductase n=1 Tax=Streptomyces lichenis TaxID=2306967 RepID=A0ABT0IJF8_9ACTN|nr:FAD-linked oxidase C-terminal domain-containing protein [Streptomyces lichenis]MCK8681479.1 FAD-binding oxidoreductase [Streptomyces lichenis]